MQMICGRPCSVAGRYSLAHRPPGLRKGINPGMLGRGMVGTATVISDKPGPVGLLATIFFWVKTYAAYQ